MTEYIDQIERFLKGNMSKEEERLFKTKLATNTHLRFYAFIVAYILKKQDVVKSC